MSRKILFFLFLLITSYQLLVTPILATPEKISDPFIGVNAKNIFKADVSESQLETALNYLANDCQVTIVRLFFEPDNTDLRQTQLDWALNTYGPETGIKFIIALGDSWNTTGGFYKADVGPTSAYQKHVANTVTKYKNHASVFAWELLNEPHCQYPGTDQQTCETNLKKFVEITSQNIRKLDPNHPILIGTIGLYEPNYQSIHSVPTIDGLTSHLYDADPRILERDQAIAIGLSKPHIVEEFNTREPDRASHIDRMITASFAQGSTGFLVWDFVISGIPDSGGDLAFSQGDPICGVLAKHSQSKPLPYSATITNFFTRFINWFFQPLTNFLKLVIQNPRRRTATDFGGDPNITTLNSDIGQTITCAYQTDISQDFDPDQFADQLDPNVSVTINGQVHLGDKYSNTSNSNAVNIYYSSRSLDGSDFNTFNPGNSINERMLSQDLLHELRYQNLILSAYSHSPDPNLNTQGVTDDPVGFSCPQSNHTCLPAKEYSTLAEDIQKTCRPIYATEIVYSQKVPFYTSDSYQTLTPVNLPPDALDLINQFYPNSYNSQHPDTPFSLINTPNDCYHLLYNQMSLANINSIETYYTITDDSSQPKQANRAIPAGIYTNQAIIKSSGMNIPQDLQDDVDIDPDQFCHRLSQSITNPDQLQDIKIPVQKRGLFDFLKKKATSPVTIQLSLPLTYAQQLQKEWARNSMFIPQELSVTNQACSSTNSDATDTGLCTSESQQRVRDMLTPEDWHQTKQL